MPTHGKGIALNSLNWVLRKRGPTPTCLGQGLVVVVGYLENEDITPYKENMNKYVQV
jgi:hypothetical protein